MASPRAAHVDLGTPGLQQGPQTKGGGMEPCVMLHSWCWKLNLVLIPCHASQDLDALELFAGSGEVTGAIQEVAWIHLCGFFVCWRIRQGRGWV